ncbi:hypothetical protein BJP36_36030 [Moorena producens JHB]|uniref:Uncharacterized protein n=1 Tax=Moorena producens (strain JHB) TaxID=1454205 RepID=A0A9Q9STQ9_MOOP1|nr:hypothetical protein [Moorena producens]WAN69504.1 hypothetical protein BJP36_36030 [Moorena producens JHB]
MGVFKRIFAHVFGIYCFISSRTKVKLTVEIGSREQGAGSREQGAGRRGKKSCVPLDATHRYSRFPIPDSRFPIPDSRFPIPDSRFPIPDSRFPIPYS